MDFQSFFGFGLTPCQGGHTLFPLAQRPSSAAPVGLGELLLEHVQHTGAAPGLEAAVALTAWAERLAAAACQGFEAPGLAVAPLAGRCVAFWSRDALGRLEPAAWHGGAATQRPKWTLQPLGVKSGAWTRGAEEVSRGARGQRLLRGGLCGAPQGAKAAVLRGRRALRA